MIRASPGHHVTPLYSRAPPGHLVTFTPASASTRSRLASLVSTSAAPWAASTSASRPATGLDQIDHAWSPHAPASFLAVHCSPFALGAIPPFLHQASGANPPCFGVKPRARCPATIVPRTKASEATLHASRATPFRLTLDISAAQTAVRHSTDRLVPGGPAPCTGSPSP